MNSQGSVFHRCGCRDIQTGAQLGAECPRREEPGHGSWYFAVDVPRVPDGCGRHRVRRGGYPTREAALAAMAEIRRPDLRDSDPASISTGAWLRAWMDSRASLAPLTRHAYEIHIRLYLEPNLGRVPLAELRTAHIQDMFNQLAQRGAGGKPLSASTLARVRATLRAAMNAAIREGLLTHNPATHLELASPRKPRAVIWTDEQLAQYRITGERPSVAVWTAAQTAAFLHASREHRLYAAFHLIALRGLRRAEAAGLRWCDVDLEHRILMITQTTQRIDGHLMQCPPKSASSRRMVVLDHTTVNELRRHHTRQQAEAAQRGIEPSGYVFTNRRGQPLNPDHLYREFIKAAAAAGMPPIRLHDLRHGAASLALQAGADLKVIQDKLGHSSIVLTADTYVSVEPDLARQEAEATARLIIDAARYVPGTRRTRRRAGSTPPVRKRATRPQVQRQAKQFPHS